MGSMPWLCKQFRSNCSTAERLFCGLRAAGSVTWAVAAKGRLTGEAPAARPLRVLDPGSTGSRSRLRSMPRQNA
jgi:hypothetical protein